MVRSKFDRPRWGFDRPQVSKFEFFHLLKTPGKKKTTSSDKFLLKPTRENKNIFLSNWKGCESTKAMALLDALDARTVGHVGHATAHLGKETW